jgi:hypothetical protein
MKEMEVLKIGTEGVTTIRMVEMGIITESEMTTTIVVIGTKITMASPIMVMETTAVRSPRRTLIKSHASSSTTLDTMHMIAPRRSLEAPSDLSSYNWLKKNLLRVVAPKCILNLSF